MRKTVDQKKRAEHCGQPLLQGSFPVGITSHNRWNFFKPGLYKFKIILINPSAANNDIRLYVCNQFLELLKAVFIFVVNFKLVVKLKLERRLFVYGPADNMNIGFF